MKRYHGVRGGDRVAAIVRAVEASGGRVVSTPEPSIAPFEVEVEFPEGSRRTLVCYAFTANKYRQDGRPHDEHRFQVKYGSEFDRPHDIYIDAHRHRITLFFGVHEEWDLFIAADPAMHHPTWFSSSVEMKEVELDTARAQGWHGWERERVALGRRRVHPLENLTTEVLLAFRPEHFLTYIRFEQMATGMDPGERLLLIEKIGAKLRDGSSVTSLLELPPPGATPEIDHALLRTFNMPLRDLLGMISENFRLLAAVRGGVAEYHLGRFLARIPELSDVQKLDMDGEPDFVVTYRRRRVRIECKNVLRTLVGGAPRVDFQKTRASKKDPCSRYYAASQFEVLAACVHPVTEHWDFRFALTGDLDAHRRCQGKLAERVIVDGARWTDDLPALLERL